MSQVIVTTGDLKRDYEILGPVCVMGLRLLELMPINLELLFALLLKS